jgi:predicted amidohydrolase
MKVAAYQCPLLGSASMRAVDLIGNRVRWSEANGVEILCCPEAVLGGLADYAKDPAAAALSVVQLGVLLKPLASHTVTTILGFTEISGGLLYNSAAVFHQGMVVGTYRKQHPAIRSSVYTVGMETRVFTVGELTFGILICNDSNFEEPGRSMIAKGATAFFVPTNCGLPERRAGAEIVSEARKVDVAWARKFGVAVIRADVVGRCGALYSFGCSGIVNAAGAVVQDTPAGTEALLVADILRTPAGLDQLPQASQLGLDRTH